MSSPLIEIINIRKYYPLTSSIVDRFIPNFKMVKALNGVTLSIYEGETLGLVGESGCGKSTLGRIIVGLEKATEGYCKFKGKRIDEIKKKSDIKNMRKQMQMMFQNPSSSLDPRMTVKQILAEPFEIHNKLRKKELDKKISELLEMVGLNPADSRKYSNAFSDGQKQRIAIIRALALNPEFIVADEPVSALDVSVQAQILNLMKSIQKGMHLTMLFISHDLKVVRVLSDRIGVLYLGKIVELGPSEDFFDKHFHPYSEGLLSSVLDLDPEIDSSQFKITADVAVSQVDIPSGCVFHLRCPEASGQCKSVEPELREISKDHFVACLQR